MVWWLADPGSIFLPFGWRFDAEDSITTITGVVCWYRYRGNLCYHVMLKEPGKTVEKNGGTGRVAQSASMQLGGGNKVRSHYTLIDVSATVVLRWGFDPAASVPTTFNKRIWKSVVIDAALRR